MKTRRLALLLTASFVIATAAIAQEVPVRKVPARDLPTPTADVSEGMQKVIGGPLQSVWNDHPKDAEAWKAWVKTRSDGLAATLPELRSRLGVKVEPTTIAGVPAFVVTPSEIPEANRNRLLFHVHGGGYVLFPGESGTREASSRRRTASSR